MGIVDKKKILVANTDKLAQKSLYELLSRNDYKVDVANSPKEAISHLNNNHYQIVLADVNGSGGIDLLKEIKRRALPSQIIILTSYSNVETAVKTMQMGAFDYLVRPVEDDVIISTIRKALTILDQTQASAQAVPLKHASEKSDTYHGLVGKSHSMRAIHSVLERISKSKATVLLRGESGTGKRLVAYALHQTDKARRDMPFVEISCGALPREIIESELFGHTKGSFTGAVSDRKGRFELADKGTILLDDIDSLPLDLQVKLLRVLQHKEFERVGDNTTIKVDLRIVVSTNQDIEKLVAEKKFREDLYYRLNVISINIPPLRERKEDIAHLIRHFINMFSKENHKKIDSVSEKVLSILTNYSWPGNIRQLENVIERAVILDTDSIITEEDLPDILQLAGVYTDAEQVGVFITDGNSLKDALKEPEKGHILKVLHEVGWNKKKAAAKLGVNRTTLYNKLRRYNIHAGPNK